MFGFLNPLTHSHKYLVSYARVCQYQGLHYGPWSLAFHNYESVFLFQCAIDSGAVDAARLPDRECCMMQFRGPLRRAPEAEIGRYCASVAVLLGRVKLDDDIRDAGRFGSRLLWRVLSRKFDLANRYFTALDPEFRGRLTGYLAAHHELENGTRPVTIEQYAEPTAQAFAYLFGLAARLKGMAPHYHHLDRLGHLIGAAVISYDCATDWPSDAKLGQFNPLRDGAAADHALALSAHALAEAQRVARAAFGETSVSANTLSGVRDRVARAGVVPHARVPYWSLMKGCLRRMLLARTWARLGTGYCRCICQARLEPSDCQGIWQDERPPERGPRRS